MSKLERNASRRWWALALIATAQFMVIVDTSVIGAALPRIQADPGFSQENSSWVFNAYVVAFGGLLLLGGRLSDLLGARRVFTLGWAVLLAGSLVAGAALIAPSALTLLMTVFGSAPEELTKTLTLSGAAAPAGGTAGVFLGGVITVYVSWPRVFHTNIPIAVVTLIAVPAVLPTTPARRCLFPDRVDDAIYLYNLGWSLARVGDHLGVNHTTVLNKLREHGIPTRDTHGRPRVEAGDPR